MVDRWKDHPPSPQSLGRKGATITPGASDLPAGTKGVVLLTSGDVTIVPADNDDAATLTFTGAPAGFIPPYVVRRVTAATATVATIEG